LEVINFCFLLFLFRYDELVDNSGKDESMRDWHEEFKRRVCALVIVFVERVKRDESTKKTVGIANKHGKIAKRM